MPEISIIMGVYNTKNLNMLENSIDSILQQSFEDFEFIICDDGSEKNIVDFLKQVAEKDKRIIILENEKNIGLAGTLNRCIEISRGRYIFRQDDDDFSEPDRLKHQYEYLEKHSDISILGSNISLYDDTGKWGKLKYPHEPKKEDFLFMVPFMHGALAFRKESLVSAGSYLSSKETKRTEDYELLMRMYSLGFKGCNLQDELYNFREDIFAQKRRKYRYKIDEARIRYRGFKMLNMLPKGIPYIIKPLIVGIIPYTLLNLMKDIYYKRKTNM